MALILPGLNTSPLVNALGQLAQVNAAERDRVEAKRAKRKGQAFGLIGGVAAGVFTGGNPAAISAGYGVGASLAGGNTGGVVSSGAALAGGIQAEEDQTRLNQEREAEELRRVKEEEAIRRFQQSIASERGGPTGHNFVGQGSLPEPVSPGASTQQIGASLAGRVSPQPAAAAAPNAGGGVSTGRERALAGLLGTRLGPQALRQLGQRQGGGKRDTFTQGGIVYDAKTLKPLLPEKSLPLSETAKENRRNAALAADIRRRDEDAFTRARVLATGSPGINPREAGVFPLPGTGAVPPDPRAAALARTRAGTPSVVSRAFGEVQKIDTEKRKAAQDTKKPGKFVTLHKNGEPSTEARVGTSRHQNLINKGYVSSPQKISARGDKFVTMFPPPGINRPPKEVKVGSSDHQVKRNNGWTTVAPKDAKEGNFQTFFKPGSPPQMARSNSARAEELANTGYTTQKPDKPPVPAEFVDKVVSTSGKGLAKQKMRWDSKLGRRVIFGKAVPMKGLGGDPNKLSKIEALKIENQFRDDFRAETKAFVIIRDSWNRVQVSGPTAAGDLSLIFNYMKILDPGSVVRESEFATAAASGSFGERIKAAWKRLATGERLSDVMHNDFTQQSRKLFQAQNKSYHKLKKNYFALAKRAGIDPRNAIIDVGQPDAAPPVINRRSTDAVEPVSQPTLLSTPQKRIDVLMKMEIGGMTSSQLKKRNDELEALLGGGK